MPHTMQRRATLRAAMVVAMTIATAISLHAQRPDTSDVLREVAAYLEQYERQIVAVLAQEDYVQVVVAELSKSLDGIGRDRGGTRQLRSDLLILADPTGWVEFRDVFEVDGGPVRDRDERLVRLFTQPNPDARLLAGRIVEESARFNFNPSGYTFNRTLNVPMTALRYLRRENQARSTFTVQRVETREGRRVVSLKFKEQTQPPLIGSNERVQTDGTFSIEVGTGRILRSELSVKGATVQATVKVDFIEQPALHLWLPSAMEENYVLSWGMMMSGRATYANYRQFKVDVSSTVK